MSAETLRRAAALMRERAEAARAGRWVAEAEHVIAQWNDVRPVAECSGSLPEGNDANARHIASWHPAVALAVAKAMDDVALAWEICDGWTLDLDDDPIRFEGTVDGGWLAVARAYLGEASC